MSPELFAICMGLIPFGCILYVFTKKKQIKITHSIFDGAYEFKEAAHWSCPKCNLKWIEDHHIYCECTDYHEPHFHKQCSGQILKDGELNEYKIGCKFKFIMRTYS